MEFPLEFLEVLRSIWDQKGSGKCCLDEQSTRAGYGSDMRHPLQKSRSWRDVLHRGDTPAPSPTSCRRLSWFGATSWSDVTHPRGVLERWSKFCGATYGSDLVYPRQMQSDLWSDVINPRGVLERWSKFCGATYGSDLVYPRRVLSYVENLCFIWAFEVIKQAH